MVNSCSVMTLCSDLSQQRCRMVGTYLVQSGQDAVSHNSRQMVKCSACLCLQVWRQKLKLSFTAVNELPQNDCLP